MSAENDSALPELNRHIMIQYLLGELPPAWQERFEEQFFTDKESFEQLKLVEDQLVADYVSQVLTAEQRGRFETHYLNSDRRRQKLKFALTLKQSLREFSETKKDEARFSFWQSIIFAWRIPPLRYVFLALILVALMGGGGLISEGWRLRQQRKQLEAERAALRQQSLQPFLTQERSISQSQQSSTTPSLSPNTTLSEQQQSERSRIIDSTVLNVVLYAGAYRDGEAQQENIPLSAPIKSLKLKLILPPQSDYTKYCAVIETPSGQRLATRENLSSVKTSQGDFVLFQISAQRLPANDYILTLSGKKTGQDYEEISDYQFRISRR
jgi:hypothetical protein